MLKLCLGFLVDTLFCVKWLARLSIFIHADILVLVSEFVVVVILSEWWSVPTTADYCGHISGTYTRQMLTVSWGRSEELVKHLIELIMVHRLTLPTQSLFSFFFRFYPFVAYTAVFYS